MRHGDEQRQHRRLVSTVRSRRGSEGASRFSVQLPLKPQTTKAVDECLQLRRRVPKTRRGAEYDPIGPLYVGMRWSSVLGEHPLAPFFPAGNFGHYIQRNQIGYAAKPDFGSGFTGSFTDGFSKRFYGAVTGVKRNENVCFRGFCFDPILTEKCSIRSVDAIRDRAILVDGWRNIPVSLSLKYSGDLTH